MSLQTEPAPARMSPGYVQRQLRTMDEIILSIRDASKAGQITASEKERALLADDVEAHARRVIQLSHELREGR